MTRTKKWLFIISGVVAAAIVLFIVSLPTIHHERQLAVHAKCKSNLRQVGLGLIAYAEQHEGHLPKSLHDIYPDYVDDSPGIFVCGTEEDKWLKWRNAKDPKQVRQWLERGDGSYHYIGFQGDIRKAANAKEIIIAVEKGLSHPGAEMGSVLFLDGHVESLSRRWLLRTIDRMLESEGFSPEQRAYWQGLIDGMKVEGKP